MPFKVLLPPEVNDPEFKRDSPINIKPVRPVWTGEEYSKSVSDFAEVDNQSPSKESAEYLTLTVIEQKKVRPPIYLSRGVSVIQLDRFIEATIRDLASYVAAENKGLSHWV